MKRVYIVKRDNYSKDPALAFEDENDAVEVAESIYGRVTDVEEHIVSVPLVMMCDGPFREGEQR